jgi:hypothetical protein
MAERLELLEQKVDAVLDLLEKLRSENAVLREENVRLEAELGVARRRLESLKLSDADRSIVVKEKLQLVLSRLEEIESLQA